MLKGGYRNDIDGLRAISALLVLIFHFDLFGIGEAGFVGVDIFFVISGYLITTIIWDQLGRGEFRLGQFYLARVRRLAPALFAVQAGVIVLAAVLLLPSEITGVVRESVAAQFYVSNIYYWRTLNYFGIHASSAYLLHTWSLGVEEQFYLLYPLLLIAVHRWLPKRLLPVLIGVFAISFALNLAFVHGKPEATFYLLPTRAWELAAGALLGFVQPAVERASPTLRAGLAALGLALLVAAIVVYKPDTPFPGWYALLPVAAASALLLAGTGTGNVISGVLSLPVFTFFGRISYPLYLVHWPLHIFGLTLLPHYTLAWRWALFALSILLAYLITEQVERPVRRRRLFPTNPALLRGYALGLGAVAVIALSAWATDGWRFRFGSDVLRVADVADDTNTIQREWDYRPGVPIERQLRPLGTPGVPPTWLVYGDSHSAALAGAISDWLVRRGEAGQLGFHSGCLPLLDTGGATCREFNRHMVTQAAGKQVLLISIWRQPIESGYSGKLGRTLEGRLATDDFQQAMVRTVGALRAAGGRVHVWEPLPPARYSVPEATARDMLFGNHWPTGHPLSDTRREMAFFYRSLDLAQVPLADRIDPAPTICPNATCQYVRQGLPIYSDTNHPAQHLRPWFSQMFETGPGAVKASQP